MAGGVRKKKRRKRERSRNFYKIAFLPASSLLDIKNSECDKILSEIRFYEVCYTRLYECAVKYL